MLLTGQCLHSLYSRTSMLVCDPRDKHVVHGIHVKFTILLQLSLYRHIIHYLFFNKISDCYAAIWALFIFSTLFSKRSAHWFHQVLLVTHGHWPRPRVMFGPTQWWMCRTPYFSSSPPRFWVLGFAASVYFLSVETVSRYSFIDHLQTVYPRSTGNNFCKNTHFLAIYEG